MRNTKLKFHQKNTSKQIIKQLENNYITKLHKLETLTFIAIRKSKLLTASINMLL